MSKSNDQKSGLRVGRESPHMWGFPGRRHQSIC